MRHSRALAGAVTCAIAGSLPAAATAAIAPGALVAPPADMPGFVDAGITIRSATSPSRYARVVLGEPSGEARSEAARLKRKGFREGVEELLSTHQTEAVSFALVLGSSKVAEQEFRSTREREVDTAERNGHGGATVKQFALRSVPGSFAFGVQEAGHTSAVANVLFATGRCFFLVGDLLSAATTEQASAAPLAGAAALYPRVKGLCAVASSRATRPGR